MTRFPHHLVILVVALAVASSGAIGWACINTYSPDTEPSQETTKSSWGDLSPEEYLQQLKSEAIPLTKTDEKELQSYLQSPDFQVRTNGAVALIKNGDYQRAAEVLAEIAVDHPDEYIVAANLGTAYELVGDNARAYEWIKKGMDLNPDSHQGTEWLHLSILKAKLKLAEDPAWLQSHSVLGLDFGNDGAPHSPVGIVENARREPASLKEVRHAIEYQLHERMALVKPKDAIVGDLLADLGNLLVLDKSAQHAQGVYNLAMTYGAPREEVVTDRLGRLVSLSSEHHAQHSGSAEDTAQVTTALLMGAGMLGVAAIAGICIKSRKRRQPPAATV